MIYEVIISTMNEDELHVAPMGVSQKADFVAKKPFKPSKTLDILTQKLQL